MGHFDTTENGSRGNPFATKSKKTSLLHVSHPEPSQTMTVAAMECVSSVASRPVAVDDHFKAQSQSSSPSSPVVHRSFRTNGFNHVNILNRDSHAASYRQLPSNLSLVLHFSKFGFCERERESSRYRHCQTMCPQTTTALFQIQVLAAFMVSIANLECPSRSIA
jgi:hypothetical protein